MSGILTIKTKVACAGHIELAAKQMGLKCAKNNDQITVSIANSSYGSMTFKKGKGETYTANGDSMHRREAQDFIQACNVVAVKSVLAANGFTVTSETGMRALRTAENYVIQAQ